MKTHGKWRIVLFGIFIIYCAVMLWLLFGRTQYDIGKSYWEQVKMNINLKPFNTISGYVHILIYRSNEYLLPHAFINLLGNIIAFVPLGFFLPVLWRKLQSHKSFLCCSIAIITSIEIIQLFSLMGSCDIDDLILNIVGVIFGYLIFLIIRRLRWHT